MQLEKKTAYYKRFPTMQSFRILLGTMAFQLAFWPTHAFTLSYEPPPRNDRQSFEIVRRNLESALSKMAPARRHSGCVIFEQCASTAQRIASGYVDHGYTPHMIPSPLIVDLPLSYTRDVVLRNRRRRFRICHLTGTGVHDLLQLADAQQDPLTAAVLVDNVVVDHAGLFGAHRRDLADVAECVEYLRRVNNQLGVYVVTPLRLDTSELGHVTPVAMLLGSTMVPVRAGDLVTQILDEMSLGERSACVRGASITPFTPPPHPPICTGCRWTKCIPNINIMYQFKEHLCPILGLVFY